MHQPRPYGLHAIGSPLTEKDEAFISASAKRITNLKGVSGIDSLRMVYDLPDGGYVIVQDMGGSFRAIAHKPMPETSIPFDGIAKDFIPMLYSGVITNPLSINAQGVGVRLTEMARDRLRQYDPEEKLPPKSMKLLRFRVDYHPMFQEFIPKEPDARYLKTQYTELRPTWYSGAMAEVVQIVGGYGRQDTTKLTEESTNEFEYVNMILPEGVTRVVREQIGNVRLPAFTGIPDINGMLKYDYKFTENNNIGFDNKGKPWLLKIGGSGVWAMPMPYIPATATDEFRRYIDEDVQDHEILAILDRFGAMPSGESFPIGNDFESWRRAGAIIKVCDTSDFYQHIAYSTAMGWSMNAKGTEGYNTCYDYDYEEGLAYGLTYKLRLDLVYSDEFGGAKPIIFDLKNNKHIKAIRYMNQLTAAVGMGDNKARAIMYKLRRATFDEIYKRADSISDGAVDVDYWDNLEMEPISDHKGNMLEVGRGWLYHPAKPMYQPQIKFAEPWEGGCISHNFQPLSNGRYKESPPNSDTTMLAYYVGNEINVVKYFVDWSSFKRSTTSNFEKYMRAGSWEQIDYSGKTSVQGYFYSSSIDNREVVSPTTVYQKITGLDKGFDTVPKFGFDAFNSMCGTLTRDRYYTHLTDTITDTGKVKDIGVCMPYLCRNSIIMVRKDTVSTRATRQTLKLYSVTDPTYYQYWTYHPIFAYHTPPSEKHRLGDPEPSDGDPVWVNFKYYEPYGGSDFADNGDWIGGLPANYTWLIHPSSNEWRHAGGGNVPKVKEYVTEVNASSVTTGSINLSLMDKAVGVNNEIPNYNYFIGSPNDIGNVFYKDACAVVFGDSEYRSVSEPSQDSERAKWGYTAIADHKTAHHFIGVINE